MQFWIHVLFVLAIAAAEKTGNNLTLTQISNNKYALKAVVANLNIAISAHLARDPDWIKMEGCKVCDEENPT